MALSIKTFNCLLLDPEVQLQKKSCRQNQREMYQHALQHYLKY